MSGWPVDDWMCGHSGAGPTVAAGAPPAGGYRGVAAPRRPLPRLYCPHPPAAGHALRAPPVRRVRSSCKVQSPFFFPRPTPSSLSSPAGDPTQSFTPHCCRLISKLERNLGDPGAYRWPRRCLNVSMTSWPFELWLRARDTTAEALRMRLAHSS